MGKKRNKTSPISDYAFEQGLRLVEIQANLGYSSEKMAEILGVSKEMYRKYTTGESRLTSEKIELLYRKNVRCRDAWRERIIAVTVLNIKYGHRKRKRLMMLLMSVQLMVVQCIRPRMVISACITPVTNPDAINRR